MALKLPQDAVGGFDLPDTGITVHLSGARSSNAQMVSDKAFYPEAATDADLLAAPQPLGLETFFVLRSVDSPQDLTYTFDLPSGASLSLVPGADGWPAGAVVERDDKALLHIPPGTAHDVDGRLVPVSYSVKGDSLTVHVPHLAASYRYPILVDPSFAVADQYYRADGWSTAANGPYSMYTGCYTYQSPNYGQRCGLIVAAQTGNYTQWYGGANLIRYAPANSYIYRGEFQYLTYGWYYQAVNEGLWVPSTNGWDASRQTNANMDNNYWTACAWDGSCNPANGSDNNALVFGLQDICCTGSYSSPSVATLAGALIYEGDRHPPAVTATNSDAPNGWVDSGLLSAAPTASDAGLGLWELDLREDGATVDSATYTYSDGTPACDGSHWTPCPLSWGAQFYYNTGSMSEGTHTMAVAAQDIVSNWSAAANWTVKVDHSPPKFTPSGSLWDARNTRIEDGTYALQVAASDPYSGVDKVQVYVDGNLVQTASGSCSASGCPTSLPAPLQWTFHSERYAAGDHKIKVIATDQLQHPSVQEWTVTVAHAASSGIGPGEVNLRTGNFTVARSDATVDTTGEGLGITRTYNSRDVAADSSTLFGPGWYTSLPVMGPTADFTALAVEPDDSIHITTSDGLDVQYANDFTPPPGYEDLKLTHDSAGDSYRLSDADGNSTTFTKVGTSYLATSVQEAGNTTTTSLAYDSQGRLLRATAPAPKGVDCSGAPVTTKGCRSLTFTYASATTATGTSAGGWGDYAGRVTHIDLAAWDPSSNSMSTTPVAQYQYDTTGHLRSAWDPRISPALTETYEYDSSGHITGIAPPGQAPWTINYTQFWSDTDAGRLQSVSRPDLSGTATSTVAYGVPLAGSGAPNDMAESDVAAWAQQDDPTDATAVFPPDQVPSTPTGPPARNLALAANGGVASASSSLSGYPISAINDGTRETGSGYWNDGTQHSFPDWAQVAWSSPQTLNKVVLRMPVASQLSAAQRTIGSVRLQYWDLSAKAWQDIAPTNGTSNPVTNWLAPTKVDGSELRTFTFDDIMTSKVRVLEESGNSDGWSYLEELEAYGPPNLALSGSASASSVHSGYPVSAINNGARETQNGYWNDGTQNSFPDWAQVAWDSPQTLNKVVLRMPVAGQLTAAQRTIGSVRLQYWDAGAADWRDVAATNGTANPVTNWLAPTKSDGSETRTFTFDTVTTTKVRVLEESGNSDGWSYLEELEAYGPPPPPTDYGHATIHYLDDRGREVNTGAPGGHITTSEYDAHDNVIRTLTAANRERALAAGSNSAAQSQLLETRMTYSTPGSDKVENLVDQIGPQHQVQLASGESVNARQHIHTTYDEGKPDTQLYHLPTTVTEAAQISGRADADVRTTKIAYGGQTNLGWKLRKPTSTTADPAGLNLTTTTLYDADTGKVTETRQPANPSGGDAHATQTVYYANAANTADPECGSHPEWAGLACKTKPAAQPGTPGLPDLPITTYQYNRLNEITQTTDAVGSATRTTTIDYDAAGRQTSKSVTSSEGTPVPTVTTGYDPTTGAPTTTSSTDNGVTRTITRQYDLLGRMTSYTDADGNTSTTSYDIDGRPTSTSDGKGTQTFTYDSTTGLLTQLDDSAAGKFTATYDADGNLVTQTLPGGLQQRKTYDETGALSHLAYVKTTNCSGGCTWLDFGGARSIHDQWLHQSGTLGSQDYSYDAAGRLTQASDNPSGKGCTVRDYAFDRDSNRTSQTTHTPGTDGSCDPGSAGTTLTHQYDAADRLADPAAAYDSFGRTTALSGTDAGGGTLTNSYYADDLTRSASQDGVTRTYERDPAGRLRAIETAGGDGQTHVLHYSDDSDSSSWETTSSDGFSWSRSIEGIDGDLATIQDSSSGVTLELENLHGDTVAEASLDPNATGLSKTLPHADEFGKANGSVSPGTYSWLGSKRRRTELASGVMEMGQREYVPAVGRFAQTDPVFNGSANDYDYANQDPVNGLDLSGTRTDFPGPLHRECAGWAAGLDNGAPSAHGISVSLADAGIGCNFSTYRPRGVHVLVQFLLNGHVVPGTSGNHYCGGPTRDCHFDAPIRRFVPFHFRCEGGVGRFHFHIQVRVSGSYRTRRGRHGDARVRTYFVADGEALKLGRDCDD